ncbi:MAG: hypothetical protein V4674_01830 [Patescibacteria group bacterium]
MTNEEAAQALKGAALKYADQVGALQREHDAEIKKILEEIRLEKIAQLKSSLQ